MPLMPDATPPPPLLNMAMRRGLPAQSVVPRPVDFGSLLAEQASAAKLMVNIARS